MVSRFLIFFTLLYSVSFAQIAVTNNAPNDTEAYLVNNVLCDEDLTTSNFSSVGFANGIGYFDGFNANIGFEEGVILSTGGLDFVTDGFGTGSGVSGDDDLEDALSAIGMTGFSVNNVTMLEFDFVANSESVAFNYVFGSMEYTSYTCSQFNDIFGFFLSGPGIAGPYTNGAVNIALVPETEGAVDYDDWVANNTGIYTTTPVAINTINDGEMTNDPDCNSIDPDFEDYNIFWYDNDYTGAGWEGVNQPPAPESTVEGITGFTAPLTAVYDGLQCGETYHIKLAIADCWDSALNSVVFLEANSFVSPSVVVNPLPNVDGPSVIFDNSAIYEGCGVAQLEFSAAANSEEDIQLEVLFDGAAEYGVDFDVSYNGGNALDACVNNDGIPSQCVTIPQGQSLMYLNIEAIFDNDDSEVFEPIEITINAVQGLCQQAEVSVSTIYFNLYDQIPIVVNPGEPAVIECFGDEVVLEPLSVTGGYLGPTIGVDVDDDWTGIIDDGDSFIIDDGFSPGSGDYTYQWYENGVLLESETASSLTITSESNTEYQLIVSDDCQDQQVETSFMVEVIEYPPLQITDTLYYACYGETVVLMPTITGGSDDYSYVWDDSDPCLCDSFNYDFDLIENNASANPINSDVQTMDFQIIDNCSNDSLSVSITIQLNDIEPPSVEIVQIGEQFCPGDEITLNVELEGESTYTYEWVDLDSEEVSVNVSPDEYTVYEVIVKDECTEESLTFEYTTNPPVYDPPTFTIDDVVGCPSETVEISVENLVSQGVQSDDDYTFLWSNGETTQSIIVEVPEQETSFSVEVFDFCGTASVIEGVANVSLSVAPIPEFSYDQDGPEIQFYQLTQDVFADFEWDFGDGSALSYDAEPVYEYQEAGDYYVNLKAWDEFGCFNTSTILVNIYPTLLFYSPNVFSPNGDGLNDSFKVSVVGYDDFELLVYDRWGKKVFSTTNPEEGWDGTYGNGEEAPQDVYMYKVYMSKSGSNNKMEKGRVSIIK
jgi:gliding motility-associated-like protein